MHNQTALIAGSSGLIGTALTDALRQRGAEVRRLVRRDVKYADEYLWNPFQDELDERALKGVDIVVNLSGANVGEKRWTEERRRTLYDSRIVTTRVLAQRMSAVSEPPSVFVAQSAIGYYGDRGDEILTEGSSAGPDDDFLASLTIDWEAAAAPARDAGIRVVHPRTGLVLAGGAPLLNRLVPLFRAGLGGRLGDGSQWWSWVDIDDAVRAMVFLIESDLSGPFNITSPVPARQREFAAALASVLSRPAVLPVPSFAMKLALGSQKAEAIGLSSARAIPESLTAAGYGFGQVDLERSLRKAID